MADTGRAHRHEHQRRPAVRVGLEKRGRSDPAGRFGTGAQRLYATRDTMHVTAITDNTGAIQERYAYEAFGATLYMTPTFGTRTSSSFGWETTFCSYRLDAETGFYQVRYRYLQPTLGRWLSRDPLVNAEIGQGASLYEYVANNPLILLDPLGLHCRDCEAEYNDCIVEASDWYNSEISDLNQWYSDIKASINEVSQERQQQCYDLYGHNPLGNTCAAGWSTVASVEIDAALASYLSTYALTSSAYAGRLARCAAQNHICEITYGLIKMAALVAGRIFLQALPPLK